LHGNPPQGSPSNSPTPLFSFSLHYNDLSALQQSQKQAQYNGNIGGQRWRSALDGKVYSYAYTYDGASRLKSAYFLEEAQHQNPPAQANQVADYFEGDFTYDANGNIQNLTRKGYLETDLNGNETFGTLDALSYNYQGNQLINVTDATNDLDRDKSLGDFRDGNQKVSTGLNDYLYDDNGNLLQDRNKNISAITYNHLNLPEQILFGEDGQNYLRFVYDAAGVKLRQEVWQEGQLEKWTDYEGNFIYEQGKLAFFHTAEGRAVAQYLPQGEGTQPTFAYEYIIKDHLGNNRVSFREDETETYLATMDGADNEGGFHNIPETRSNGGFMNTSASKTEVSQPIGVWKTLQVSKGDTLQLSTVAKYDSEATENKSTQVSPILTNSGSSAQNPDSSTPNPEWILGVAISPASNNAEEGLPLAMLKAVLYEADGQTVIEERNTEITESAYQAWETLSSEWVMPENGLLQVSVVNTSDTEVLFDNVMVEYVPTLIAQEQHFYPFGMVLKGLEKQGQPQHRFTYNGKEEINDLGLGWIDYEARMYDPVGVRWWSLDLLAEKYSPITPYAYVGNSPMVFTDPNGMEIDWGNMNRQDKRAIKKEVRQLRKSQVFNDAWKQLKKSDKVFTIEASRSKAASGAYKAGNGELAGAFEGNYGSVMSMTVPSDPANPSGGTTTMESRIQ
ncbi:MAG: RHS repeat-associated core domain-containing protein, partial [Bacteroidota bacterium]